MQRSAALTFCSAGTFCSGEQSTDAGTFCRGGIFAAANRGTFAATAAGAAEVQRVPQVRVNLCLFIVLLFKHKPPLKFGIRHTHAGYFLLSKFCGML